jgi:hypothetical protein
MVGRDNKNKEGFNMTDSKRLDLLTILINEYALTDKQYNKCVSLFLSILTRGNK